MTDDDTPTVDELTDRRPLFGAASAEELREAYDAAGEAGDYAAQDELREWFRRWDSGRTSDVLAALHESLAHADLERREAFLRAMPGAVEWAATYGALEGLTRFARLRGEEPPRP